MHNNRKRTEPVQKTYRTHTKQTHRQQTENIYETYKHRIGKVWKPTETHLQNMKANTQKTRGTRTDNT